MQLATDVDVHGDIIRGLRRHRPEIDIIRATDHLPDHSPDEEVLAWAVGEGRVLVTNDRNTMVSTVYSFLNNHSMCGAIVTSNQQSIGEAISDILLIVDCMTDEEIQNRVIFLPL